MQMRREMLLRQARIRCPAMYSKPHARSSGFDSLVFVL